MTTGAHRHRRPEAGRLGREGRRSYRWGLKERHSAGRATPDSIRPSKKRFGQRTPRRNSKYRNVRLPESP